MNDGDNSLNDGDNSLNDGDNFLNDGDNSLNDGDNSLNDSDNSWYGRRNSLNYLQHSPSCGSDSDFESHGFDGKYREYCRQHAGNGRIAR